MPTIELATMIRTTPGDLLRVRHPVVPAGRAARLISREFAAAVSHAGGLGILGLGRTAPRCSSDRTPDRSAAFLLRLNWWCA